jgi:hypothetical protein
MQGDFPARKMIDSVPDADEARKEKLIKVSTALSVCADQVLAGWTSRELPSASNYTACLVLLSTGAGR